MVLQKVYMSVHPAGAKVTFNAVLATPHYNQFGYDFYDNYFFEEGTELTILAQLNGFSSYSETFFVKSPQNLNNRAIYLREIKPPSVFLAFQLFDYLPETINATINGSPITFGLFYNNPGIQCEYRTTGELNYPEGELNLVIEVSGYERYTETLIQTSSGVSKYLTLTRLTPACCPGCLTIDPRLSGYYYRYYNISSRNLPLPLSSDTPSGVIPYAYSVCWAGCSDLWCSSVVRIWKNEVDYVDIAWDWATTGNKYIAYEDIFPPPPPIPTHCLTITCNTPGAFIKLDGVDYGSNGFYSTNFPENSEPVLLTVDAEDFISYGETLTLGTEDITRNITLLSCTPPEIRHNFTVNYIPKDAVLTLNGGVYGVDGYYSTTFIENGGNVTLNITKTGYVPYTETIVLGTEDIVRDIILQPIIIPPIPEDNNLMKLAEIGFFGLLFLFMRRRKKKEK